MMAGGPLTRIAASIKRRGTKGVFSREAKEHGESTREYAEQEKHAKGKLGRRARLALTFMKARKK